MDEITPVTSGKTPGEILFEEYLHVVGIKDFEFERRFPESSKRPDYSFPHDGTLLVMDVKDFRGEPKDFGRGFGFFDPYAPLREKINEGLRKFRDFKKYPCALVLYNHDKPLVDLSPMIVYGAMLGDLAWTFPVNTSTGAADLTKEEMAFAGRGKMIQYGREKKPIKPQNTTISAVIVIGRLLVGEALCLASIKSAWPSGCLRRYCRQCCSVYS